MILRIAILILFLANISCKNNPASINNNTDNFSVTINVKDSNGQPVQGISVSIYNDADSSSLGIAESPKVLQANTSILFSVAESSLVSLGIYELDGRLVQNLATDRNLGQGVFEYVVSLNVENVGTRVYKGILTAVNDTTKQVLFKDSIYITLLDNSPENSILGYTSKSGTFETTDSLSFPNILTLPPIVETNATGPAPIGVFSFSQSIVITLIDTVTSRSVSYVRQVIKGQNVFNLTWNPSSGSTSTNPSVSMERLERMNPFFCRYYNTTATTLGANAEFPKSSRMVLLEKALIHFH